MYGSADDLKAAISAAAGADLLAIRTPGLEETLLMRALMRMDNPAAALQMSQLLLDAAPAMANLKSSKYADAQSPLHIALHVPSPQQPAIVKLLLDKGAQASAKNSRGETPLHIAARTAPLEVVALLLEKNANVMAKTHYEERTPLHVAAMRVDEPRIIEELLAKTNNLNGARASPQGDCEQPLHVAAAFGNAEAVKRILAKTDNADPRSCEAGLTPLMLLSKAQGVSPEAAVATATLLLDKNPGMLNGQATPGGPYAGYYPLHFAAAAGNMELVKLFVQRGANPLLEASEANSTPARLAATPEIAAFLQQQGQPNATRTPPPPNAARSQVAANAATPPAPAPPPPAPTTPTTTPLFSPSFFSAPSPMAGGKKAPAPKKKTTAKKTTAKKC